MTTLNYTNLLALYTKSSQLSCQNHLIILVCIIKYVIVII